MGIIQMCFGLQGGPLWTSFGLFFGAVGLPKESHGASWWHLGIPKIDLDGFPSGKPSKAMMPRGSKGDPGGVASKGGSCRFRAVPAGSVRFRAVPCGSVPFPM